MKYLKLFESFSGRISENLQYHIDNNKPIVEIEVNPMSKYGKPEIMSIYSDIRKKGLPLSHQNKGISYLKYW